MTLSEKSATFWDHAPEGSEVMKAAFNLQTEIANLAERIVGPVAAKLAQKELDTALGEIRHAFEQLSAKSAPANVDFENMAVNILEPVRARLSEADFADRRSAQRGHSRVLSGRRGKSAA